MLSRGGALGRIADLALQPGPRGVSITPVRVAAPAWYDVTWNPTAGCSPVGPGCAHCEALRTVAQLARIGGKAGARYAGLTATGRSGSRWTGELRVRDDVLTWPLLQRRGRRILVDSLSDLFHEKLATETIDLIHAVMTIAHWHRFLILTRRAGLMRSYYDDPLTPQRIAVQIEHLAKAVMPELVSLPRARGGDPGAIPVASIAARRNRAAGLARVVRHEAAPGGARSADTALDPWPLPNLWLGVAVEDQDRAARVGELMQTPAALRWVCFEPLLGPVRTDMVPLGNDCYADALGGICFSLDGRGRRLAGPRPNLPALDWVIAGGETGAGARPTDPDWLRDLRDRCRTAVVPFFFKQWGEWAPAPDDQPTQKMARRRRRAAGRLIDGRSWDELPAAMRQGSRKPR
jgi:protein gp37